MEKKTREENRCVTGDGNPVRAYCERCKVYLCSDCHITKHIDHDSEVTDLAEKATRFLADYQKLARSAILMADRRQIHINDESIDTIVDNIKKKLSKAADKLKEDVARSAEQATKYIGTSPLVQDFVHRKAELAGQPDDPLIHLKTELNAACMELLNNLTEGRLESADKLISPEKLRRYEEEIVRQMKATSKDMEYIQELHKLKSTAVQYSYDPMKIVGMVKVETEARRPERVFQFNREKNQLHLFTPATRKMLTVSLDIGFVMPLRFVCIEVAGNLYLSGGDNDSGHFLNSLYLYDELRGSLIELAHMKEPRSRHAAVTISISDKPYIFALGGEAESGVLRTCERYEVKNNAWQAAPKLNERRCSLSACAVQTVIYVFGGWHDAYLDSFERLDTAATGEKGWENVRLAKKSVLPKLQSPGLVEVRPGEMLIFGGHKEEEVLSGESFLFDTRNYSVKKLAGMKEGEAFVASETRKAGDSVFAFGYVKGGLHEYKIAKDEWSFTTQSDLVLLH